MRGAWLFVGMGLLSLSGACGRPAATSGEGAASAPAAPVVPDISILNAEAPGQALDLAQHVVPGKTTLFELYSDHCPASAEMAPVLRYLSQHHADLAIRQVAIDRPEATEIDFDSPLAEKYSLQSTPSFRIHDASGALIAQGKEAKGIVRQWYLEAQTAESAARAPRL